METVVSEPEAPPLSRPIIDAFTSHSHPSWQHEFEADAGRVQGGPDSVREPGEDHVVSENAHISGQRGDTQFLSIDPVYNLILSIP